MGLISWIKDKYNESRYQGALESLQRGNVSEGENILLDILSKHPSAIVRLAELYHKKGSSLKDVKALEEYAKVFDLVLKIDSSFIYDKTAYQLERDSVIQEIENRSDRFFSAGDYSTSLRFLDSISSYKKTDSGYVDKFNHYKLFSYLDLAYHESSATNAVQKLSLPISKIPDTIRAYKSEVESFCKIKAQDGCFYSRTLKIFKSLYPNEYWEEANLVSYFVQCALGKDTDHVSVLSLNGLIQDSNLPYFYELVTDSARSMLGTDPKSVFTICRQIIDVHFACADVYFDACKKLYSQNLKFPESEVLFNLKRVAPIQKLLEICNYFVKINSFKSLYYDTLVDLVTKTQHDHDNTSAIEVLDEYWIDDKSANIFVKLLSVDGFKVDLIRHLVDNSDKYIGQEILNTILSVLSEVNDDSFVLDCLESLLAEKYDVCALYEKRITDALDTRNLDQKLAIVNRGLTHCDSNQLLVKKLDLAYSYVSKDDLNTALQIHDEVASKIHIGADNKEKIFTIYYENVKKHIIELANSNDIEGAISYLNSKWASSSPRNIFPELLGCASLRDALLIHLTENHAKYIISEEILTSICSVISENYSCIPALDILENLHAKGYNVKACYINKVQSEIAAISIDEKELLVNRAMAVYDDPALIEIKASLLWDFANNSRYNDALRVGESLRNIYPTIVFDICFIYIELSKTSDDCFTQLQYLDKAESEWSELKSNKKGRYTKLQLRNSINSVSLECVNSFEKGKHIDEAVALASRIAAHDKSAINVIARILYNDLLGSETDSVRVETRCLLVKRAIGKLHNLDVSVLQDDDNFIGLWRCLVNSTILLHKNSNINSEYEDELCLIWSNLESCNLSAKADDIRSILLDSILEVKRTLALERESSGLFTDAIAKYEEMGNYTTSSSLWQAFRICICALKSGDRHLILHYENTIQDSITITKSTLPLELNELTYRYCVFLLNEKKFDQALDYIKRFLPNEMELLSACENQFIIAEESSLQDFNSKLSLIQSGSMSSDEAKSFLRTIDASIKKFEHIALVSSSDISAFKNLIKEYITYRLYVEENYVDCFKALKTLHGDYISNKTSMRNLAIVCLAIAENNLITDSNYEEVISIWLTSIYDERLFVDSLQQTSWDDQYTFTLNNALGNYTESNYGALPSNVNFEDATVGTYVEIRGVQTKLMSRFELSIMNNTHVFSYYQSQKKSMDALIALQLDDRCRAYAPGMLKLDIDIKREVKSALDNEEHQHYFNWESVLKTACEYGFEQGIYGDYKSAKENLSKCKSALESNNINSIKSAFSSDKVEAIKNFELLSDDLSSAVQSKFSDARSSLSIERIVSFFMPIAKSLADDNFNFAFANYIKNEIIGKVNDKDMSLATGTKLLADIYNLCPSHRQTKENLSLMISAMASNYITDGDTDNLAVLESILHSTRDFDSNVASAIKGNGLVLVMLSAANEANFNRLKSALSGFSLTIRRAFNDVSSKISDVQINMQLSEIIDKVNNDTMSKKDALSQLYDLYVAHPNNARLCENLAIISKLCIMEYIAEDKTGKLQVKQTLDRLRNNRSATFNSHNSDISDTRRQILSGMSYDNRNVLLNHSEMLNETGKALKLALDYLLYLS